MRHEQDAARLQDRRLLLHQEHTALRRVEIPQRLLALCFVSREYLEPLLDVWALVLLVNSLGHHVQIAGSQLRPFVLRAQYDVRPRQADLHRQVLRAPQQHHRLLHSLFLIVGNQI